VLPKGGQIAVALRRNKRWADLVIADNGPGVPPEDLERIFERRFSHRPPAMAEAPGSAENAVDSVHAGIGLWIVRRNIEAIGGHVRAENATTGGLIMKIQVPLAA
jgi:two-component system, OmpR family, sensor histidine kinase ChvG